MDERIFNLFIYFDGGKAHEVGAWFHKKAGTDNEKTDFLRSQVDEDCLKARRFDLPRSFTPEQWRAQLRLDGAMSIFDQILTSLKAPAKSFVYCLTPIIDGAPQWDQTSGPGAFRGEEVTDFGREGVMRDYLTDYTSGEHFHLDKLMDDDFFSAIRILFQSEHYVSASKLLMCCVDTLAFVEYGDVSRNFIEWLNKYCDLSIVGITSEELWEYRNSVLHMTNLESRAVKSGKTSRIAPYVANRGSLPPQNDGNDKPFNILELLHAVSEGIQKWGESYNENPGKVVDFIERYDTTISDKRRAHIVRIRPASI